MKSWEKCMLGLAMGLLVVAGLSFAQTVTGELVGAVYDSSGAAIPGASVIATNDGTGIKYTATSSSTGQYRLANAQAGHIPLRLLLWGSASQNSRISP